MVGFLQLRTLQQTLNKHSNRALVRANFFLPLLLQGMLRQHFLPQSLIPLQPLHGRAWSIVQGAQLHHVVH